MAENEISDYLETDNDNTDIAGISVQENVMRPPAVNNAFRALQGALKRWFKTSLFRLRDSTDQTKLLAFDLSAFTTAVTRTFAFPNRSGTVSLTSDIDVRRNRIVNHDRLQSQENGQTAGTTNGRYTSDQHAMYFVSSAGTFTGVNVTGRTSPKGGNRDRITITTADASLAAGEYLTYTTNLEGSNIADLKWGASGALQIVVRHGFKFPAGTWSVAFHNSGGSRSYVTTFTVSAGEANTDIERFFSIPGDVTGTWLTADGVIGITMDVVIGAGSTFQGVAGWQGGNMLTVSGASNGMAMSGAVFEFFDSGMRADPDATGVYGQYEVGEVHPVYRSERYLETLEVGALNQVLISGIFDGTQCSASYSFKTQKAKAPTSNLRAGASWVTNTPTQYTSRDVLMCFSSVGRFLLSGTNGQPGLIFSARLS